MEGKDLPPGHRQKYFRSLGNSVGLMLRMCEQIFGPVRCVVFDSVFYVVEGVIELRYRGFYGDSLIKNRR